MQKTFEQALQEARDKYPANISYIGNAGQYCSGYEITCFGKHLDGTYLYYIRYKGFLPAVRRKQSS